MIVWCSSVLERFQWTFLGLVGRYSAEVFFRRVWKWYHVRSYAHPRFQPIANSIWVSHWCRMSFSDFLSCIFALPCYNIEARHLRGKVAKSQLYNFLFFFEKDEHFQYSIFAGCTGQFPMLWKLLDDILHILDGWNRAKIPQRTWQ